MSAETIEAMPSSRMNEEIRDRWCDQMLSGRWEQIRGQFRGDGNQRCPMGVLLYDVLDLTFGCCPMCERSAVAESIGLTDEQFDLLYGNVVRMNDIEGKSFAEIAEYLREEW